MACAFQPRTLPETSCPCTGRNTSCLSDGANIVLTIDLRLQQIVEDALAAAMTKYRARGASAIVMNPRTFEVLAVAGLPSFNPQAPGASPAETWRNPAFSDRVEPGSTLKVITLAAALDQGLMTLDSGVYCEQGRYVVNHVSVRDHEPYGLLSLRQGFAKSSNIAFAKTALELGPQRLYYYLTNFGFGRCTGYSRRGRNVGLDRAARCLVNDEVDPGRVWTGSVRFPTSDGRCHVRDRE